MDQERPQFRVVGGLYGGVVIVTNGPMKNLLVELLQDLTERTATEAALMHALREADAPQSPRRRTSDGA